MWDPRVLSVCPLVVLAALALSSCAGTSAVSTPAPSPARDSTAVPAPPPAEAFFEPSAPDEVVTEDDRIRRRTVVSDMIRLGIITAVQQGPHGILRTAVGESFNMSSTKDLQYRRLAVAYAGWTAPAQSLVIELWDQGKKIGEFTDGAFLVGPDNAAPRDCAAPGPDGICGYGPGGAPPAVARRRTAPAAPPPTQQAAESDRRRGVHANLGLGAGAGDVVCDGCDYPSETALSGFVGLGTSVGEQYVLGVDATGWRSNKDGTEARIYGLMAALTSYPRETSGLFITAGVGLIGYQEEVAGGDLTATAVGYVGRLGYELPVSGRFTVSPYVAFLSTFGATVFKVEGDRTGEFNFNNLQAGLAIGLN